MNNTHAIAHQVCIMGTSAGHDPSLRDCMEGMMGKCYWRNRRHFGNGVAEGDGSPALGVGLGPGHDDEGDDAGDGGGEGPLAPRDLRARQGEGQLGGQRVGGHGASFDVRRPVFATQQHHNTISVW